MFFFAPTKRAFARSILAALALAGCGGTEMSSGAGAAAGSSGSGAGGTGGSSTTASGGPACKPGESPVMIASGKPGAVALAIDSDFVYFWTGADLGCTKAGTIGRAPKSGGPSEVLWETVQEVYALAVDGERVYWTDDPGNKCTLPGDPGYMLYAGPKAGGKPTVLPASQSFKAATAMTLDGDHVYWAADVQPILAASLDGSASDMFMSPGYTPSDVAVDDVRVFILGPSHIYSTVKAPKGSPTLVFEVAAAALRGLAMDADQLYFGGWGKCEGNECVHETETLRSLAKDMGSTPVTLASRPDRRTVRMAVDATHVYWTERNSPQLGPGGAVLRVARQGGETTEIATSQEPSDIAVDEACVYWAEGSSGGIWRAPKSATGATTTTGAGGGAGSATCKPGDGPTPLVTDKGQQRALAIDADFVYFAPSTSAGCDVESAIKRVPKAGGAAQTVWTTVQPITAIAVDEQRVYWSDDPVSPCLGPSGAGYLLHAAPKAGGKPAVFPAAGQTHTTFAMALDSTHVYWLDDEPSVQTVRSAPKAGGPPEVIFSANVERGTIAVDQVSLYVASGQGLSSSGKGAGSPPVLLVPPPPPISGYIGLALDASAVYFGGYREDCGVGCLMGFIDSLPKGQPGAPTEISIEQGWQPIALAVDDSHVYWTQVGVGEGKPENKQVMRAAKDGSDKTPIGASRFPINIAVDDTCVYWSDQVDGTIWKAPK